MKKVFDWIKNNKRAVWGIIIAISVIALITATLVVVMDYFGFTDIVSLQSFISRFGALSWVVFIAIQVIVVVLLCFAPATSMTFAILGNILFNDGTIWGMTRTFIILIIGTTIASQVMFLLGRFGGEKLAIKLVGKDDIEKAQRLLDAKSKVFLPIMYLLTFFPDDALCFVAGMTTMNFWRHFVYVLIFRGVGTLTICVLGTNIFDYGSFTLLDWYIFLSVSFFWFAIIFIIGKKLSDKLEKK